MQRVTTKEVDITGAGKRVTLIADAETMVKVFGSPELTQGWDKVQYMWVFKIDDEKIVTIYDYKEKREFDKIDEWSVGGKNITVAAAMLFINTLFNKAGAEYRELA